MKGLRCIRPSRHSSAYLLKDTCLVATLTSDLCTRPSDASDPLSFTPVYGSDRVQYKNIFCAGCNGLKETDVQFWSLKYHFCQPLSSTENANITILNKKCRLEITFTDSKKVRICSGNLATQKITECSNEIKNACERYSAPIVINGSLYKNPHCAECYGWNTSAVNLCSSGIPRASCDQGDDDDISRGPSVSILFDFIDDEVKIDKRKVDIHGNIENEHVGSIYFASCQQGHTFDPFLGQCRQLSCGNNFELVEDTCKASNNSSCALVTLDSTEFTWLSEDRLSFKHKKSGIVVENFTEISEERVQICKSIHDSFKIEWLRLYFAKTEGQVLLTKIGFGVSITLLSIVIITYLSFPELRNIPGKIVMSLSGALLLAQLLFVVGIDKVNNKTVCLIIAFLVHYMWLAVFFWTNAMSFDLACTFGGKIRNRQNETRSTFMKYSLYAWGMPFLVVGITGVIHFTVPIGSTLENVYDITESCWLRGGTPTLVAFDFPILLPLLGNCVLYVYTIVGIIRTRHVAKLLKQNGTDTGKYLSLCIKVRSTCF